MAVSLLESDYEHEFLLAVRLLARIMHRLPLDRPDARDKVEKLQSQLRWNSFPGVHALLLKVCLTLNFQNKNNVQIKTKKKLNHYIGQNLVS